MEQKKEEQFNLEEIKKKALEQFRSGKSLYGKDGAFTPMLKSFLEAALEGEMESHLDDDERQEGNRRNGKARKTLQTSSGPVELETSRDRNGTFEPELVKKRETVLADTLESKILGMYGLGMSFRDISSHLKEMYDADISHSTLSAITDRIIPAIKEWQARPLESLYCIVWLDAMHYKVKDQGKIVSRYRERFITSWGSIRKGVRNCWACMSLRVKVLISGSVCYLICATAAWRIS